MSPCTERAICSFNTLLKNCQLDVAYPTACCLRDIFRRVETLDHISEDTVMTMVDRVTGSASAPRVKEVLVEALEAYVASFRKRYSPMPSKIEKALVDVLCVSNKFYEAKRCWS